MSHVASGSNSESEYHPLKRSKEEEKRENAIGSKKGSRVRKEGRRDKIATNAQYADNILFGEPKQNPKEV